MKQRVVFGVLVGLIRLGAGHRHDGHLRRLSTEQIPLVELPHSQKQINQDIRQYWVRQANEALSSPCPFAPFGTVIVNHTVSGRGGIVCTGENTSHQSGNPIMHGEMAAIANCSHILTDPTGPYNMTVAEALAAFSDLTIYTNAESCPMCASAIRWAGFREYVYGTSIDELVRRGWDQIRIASREVFAMSVDLPRQTALIGAVLTNETNPLFSWQFDHSAPCPPGCSRSTWQADSICSAV
ncbi:FCY1p [Verticillium alfalfae VaMs.102]|uniref:FCY1p n=1 Tax=Verticillium alfalfae (strain VaMs.102 / ATCC MYA-4576 / FGSC 10136) TaxID=526221 RepID=C9SRP1_VERA1|nr:FCY1p [Verticillium alfalfae VaMs.102]EEY21456.1 FCY1p [Verticillium alfalfae VaMs.102]